MIKFFLVCQFFLCIPAINYAQRIIYIPKGSTGSSSGDMPYIKQLSNINVQLLSKDGSKHNLKNAKIGGIIRNHSGPLQQIPLKITEKSGLEHSWSNFIMLNDDFDFYHGEGRISLSVEKIQSIEFLKFPEYRWQGSICKVVLRSGAQKELRWEHTTLAGKGFNWLESIHTKHIQKIEFK